MLFRSHTKADHRMDRCWLKGAVGDALHALCCAAGYNIRWLLRAIARKGLAALLLALMQLVRYANGTVRAPQIDPGTSAQPHWPRDWPQHAPARITVG